MCNMGRISSCNFIAVRTIVMGKISVVGLALATRELATTDLPERSHQPGPDFVFPIVFKVAFSSLQCG